MTRIFVVGTCAKCGNVHTVGDAVCLTDAELADIVRSGLRVQLEETYDVDSLLSTACSCSRLEIETCDHDWRAVSSDAIGDIVGVDEIGICSKCHSIQTGLGRPIAERQRE